MIARSYSMVVVGSEVLPIEVEVDSTQGKPGLIFIGLPSQNLDEAKERITSALLNCSVRIPPRRTVVNLAPADVRKKSSAIELAIVCSLLKNMEQIKADLENSLFLGELSLDGHIKSVRGVLPMVIKAKELGFARVFIPEDNQAEVAVIREIDIYPLKHLQELIGFLSGRNNLKSVQVLSYKASQNFYAFNFDQIYGQEEAKRALLISAAGGHNVLMIGPPGSGKSLLAKAYCSILPELTLNEALAVTQLYSLLGKTNGKLITHPPFRSPHQSISMPGMVGGGQLLQPGEISLAHHGVLFMDEFPEFTRPCLEALRQPLQDKQITISRVNGSASYPAAFTLLAAANPCPCGYFSSQVKECRCSLPVRQTYAKRFSGPILDRIDIHLKVAEMDLSQINKSQSSSSAKETMLMKQQVSEARSRQRARYQKSEYYLNTHLESSQLKKYLKLSAQAEQVLLDAAQKLHFSTRTYFKLIKVAQTIADLANQDKITAEHILEAISYRQVEMF